jgi:hypothetical protein
VSSHDQEPMFSNDDAEIIVVDETVGVIDTTHRPASGASRKAAQKQLEKEAEFRQLMEQMAKTRIVDNRTMDSK